MNCELCIDVTCILCALFQSKFDGLISASIDFEVSFRAWMHPIIFYFHIPFVFLFSKTVQKKHLCSQDQYFLSQ